MSRQRRAQAVTAPTEQPARTLHTGDRPTQFELIPHVCLIADVCRILRLSERQFHRLMTRHQLALVELPRWDRHRRFSGESVARCLRMRKAA